MANLLEDCFYDCQSDSESTEDSELDLEDDKCDQALRAVGGYSGNHHLFSKFDDSLEMRKALERVTNTSRLLLRSVGGKCDCSNCLEKETSRPFFYPAQLEICARLITDKSCPIPPSGQCRLRGDPVTLKLPMELNPYSGQVNLPIFQPEKNVSGGCHCAGAGDRSFGAGTKPAPVSDETGHDTGLGYYGAAHRPGFGVASGGMRRHTQRHDGVRKSGRKVRWPDVL